MKANQVQEHYSVEYGPISSNFSFTGSLKLPDLIKWLVIQSHLIEKFQNFQKNGGNDSGKPTMAEELGRN